ncbi:hypothetical protein ACWXWU_12580 [Shewanella sp. A14]
MNVNRSYKDVHDGADFWLLNEAIDLCQAGQQFYSKASKGTDDYNIKRIFNHMAEIKKGMLHRLATLFKQVQPCYAWSVGNIETLKPLLSPYYAEAERAIEQKRLSQAIQVLIAAEQYVLMRLKVAAKRANSQCVARQLAESIAWLQISCDNMKNMQLTASIVSDENFTSSR